MKKFKAAPQSAKRVKAIIAAAMALTLAVPTTAYFSKASKAEAEEALPEAVLTVTMEKGFVGEKKLSGLNVVKSEQVLIFKEKLNENGAQDYVGLAKVYGVTDEPVIEADVYKYGVKGNQPSTAYDENLGSVLVFDDTVAVEEFAKKVEDDVEEIAIGEVLQKATITHSQVQINNPFAGKDLANGASVAYWAKVPVISGQAVGAETPLVVFSTKDAENRKSDANTPAEKEAEMAADAKLSVQISAGNDFHYVTDSVSVSYDGDGSILAAPDKWAYVIVTMTDNKVVTYVDGKEVSNKDVEATGMMAALADANTGVFFGGNYSPAAEKVGQNYPSVRNTCMDGMAFYTTALTAEEAGKVYNAALTEANTVEAPAVLEKFTFDNGTTGTNGTVINGMESNKVNPEVVVDTDVNRGYVLKVGAGSASKTAGAILSANPFAGKDIDGASVSYWVKEPADKKVKTVVPSVALGFIDAPKKVEHPKLAEAYVDELSSTVLFTQTDMEAYFHEGYTGLAYQSIKNDFKFWTRRNTHVDGKTDSNGKVLDALYDEKAVALQKEYETMLSGMSEWHFVTTVFSNAGIKMFLDGKELTNNKAEPEGRPEFFGPRFYDGYYQMQYDGYAPFYRASDNQGARTLMSFLTGADTSAYLGFMYKVGTNNTYTRTYETYYDNITYYGNALTADQVAKIYDAEINPESKPTQVPQIPTTEPTDTPNDVTPSPVTPGAVTPGAVTPGAVTTGDAVISTDDESVVAPKNAYTGKTGDTASVVIPALALSAAAAAFVTASKKRREIEE